MIKQAVKDFANTHGFDFYVSGLGYRGTAQITTLGDKPQSVSRCNNNSKDALQAINALIAQRKLDTKSDDAIATEAEQAYDDLLPATPAICEVEAEQAYQELLPVAPDRRRFYERTSYLGIGVEVYCGDSRYGYALAELLDRPIEIDYTLARQRMEQALDRDCDRAANFAMSTPLGCGALI